MVQILLNVEKVQFLHCSCGKSGADGIFHQSITFELLNKTDLESAHIRQANSDFNLFVFAFHEF